MDQMIATHPSQGLGSSYWVEQINLVIDNRPRKVDTTRSTPDHVHLVSARQELGDDPPPNETAPSGDKDGGHRFA
jgi:hypothetical protein